MHSYVFKKNGIFSISKWLRITQNDIYVYIYINDVVVLYRLMVLTRGLLNAYTLGLKQIVSLNTHYFAVEDLANSK